MWDFVIQYINTFVIQCINSKGKVLGCNTSFLMLVLQLLYYK